MEQVIKEREIKPVYIHPLAYNDNECFDNFNYDSKKLKIILIEKGSGTLSLDNYETMFTAPAILCLKEDDFPKLTAASKVSAKSINFEPWAINSGFNYDNFRDEMSNFTATEQQDLYLLKAFVEKDFKHYNINIPAKFNEYIIKLFKDVGRVMYLQSDASWPCRSRSIFLELLVLITKLVDNENNNTENEAPGRVNEVIAYIQTSYRNKLTLNELARVFNTNRTTLNDEFYKETNQSLIDYLIKYRMNLAAALLRDTLLPVAEIMERVGFNDTSHFWRMFKKTTGLSPSEYRKRYCWMK